MIFRDILYRHRELRQPKFKKRRKQLVWRTPKPIQAGSGSEGDYGWAVSYMFPTVSPRRWRYFGRREVYPHATHVHFAHPHHIREP